MTKGITPKMCRLCVCVIRNQCLDLPEKRFKTELFILHVHTRTYTHTHTHTDTHTHTHTHTQPSIQRSPPHPQSIKRTYLVQAQVWSYRRCSDNKSTGLLDILDTVRALSLLLMLLSDLQSLLLVLPLLLLSLARPLLLLLLDLPLLLLSLALSLVLSMALSLWLSLPLLFLSPLSLTSVQLLQVPRNDLDRQQRSSELCVAIRLCYGHDLDACIQNCSHNSRLPVLIKLVSAPRPDTYVLLGDLGADRLLLERNKPQWRASGR